MRVVTTLLCALFAVPVMADVTVEFGHWAPDRGTPYAWFEGAKELQTFFSDGYHTAGAMHVYLRNGGTAPLSVTGWQLDGRPLDELREARQVIWWRMLPEALPAGQLGEVTVRLRRPLTQAAKLSLACSDGSAIETTIRPEPAPVRIETVGFEPTGRRVFLVAEPLSAAPPKLVKVGLDGADLTASARLLDPSFRSGTSPVVLELPEPLVRGSYHVFTVTAGDARVGCALRVTDGWVPLGTYGYGQLEEYARNGVNSYANFGRSPQSQLDSEATLGMRGASGINANTPQPYEIGHPGLFAYYLQDEPDCLDYGVKSIPAHERVGSHAMEMERRRRTCVQADPTTPTLLTIDMTFKPANYYIYGPLTDVCNVDCYPLVHGSPLSQVREVVETCRRGVGPRQLTFTFQSQWEEPDDPAARAKQKFPRPPTAGEVRLMILEAVGGGARGLYNYIHCSEHVASWMSHGSNEYPDVWAAIGRCYRELANVSGYLALAHPAGLADCSAPKVRANVLLCGEDALLLGLANQDYVQEQTAFRVTPATDLTVTLPDLPWLRPAGAWRITEDGAEPLKLDGARLTLPRVETAELVLVSSDGQAGAKLAAAAERRREQVGAALLTEWRNRQRAAADRAALLRRLAGECADFMVQGAPIAAYGSNQGDYWNPTGAKHPTFEFGINQGGEDRPQGAQWKLSIPAELAGQEQRLYLMVGNWGAPLKLTVTAADGQLLRAEEAGATWSGEVRSYAMTFPAAGEYTLQVIQTGKAPRGGRVGATVYLVPRPQAP